MKSSLPVIVVARHRPDLPAIRTALLGRVRGGARKWWLIEADGRTEPVAGGVITGESRHRA